MSLRMQIYIFSIFLFISFVLSQVYMFSGPRLADLLKKDTLDNTEISWIASNIEDNLPMDQTLINTAIKRAAKNNNIQLIKVLEPYVNRNVHREVYRIVEVNNQDNPALLHELYETHQL